MVALPKLEAGSVEGIRMMVVVMFYFLIGISVTQVYACVKTHQMVYLKLHIFYFIQILLKNNKYQTLVNSVHAKVFGGRTGVCILLWNEFLRKTVGNKEG